jgi:hypothetical protein
VIELAVVAAVAVVVKEGEISELLVRFVVVVVDFVVVVVDFVVADFVVLVDEGQFG